MSRDSQAFWRGASRGFGETWSDVMNSELGLKMREKWDHIADIEREEEDRKESTSLQNSIIGDQELTPEERAQFSQQFGDGSKPLSKEARDRLAGSYDTFKKNKKALGDKTVEEKKKKDEETTANKNAMAARKRIVESLPKEDQAQLLPLVNVENPTAADVTVFDDQLKAYREDVRDKRNFAQQQQTSGEQRAYDTQKTATDSFNRAVDHNLEIIQSKHADELKKYRDDYLTAEEDLYKAKQKDPEKYANISVETMLMSKGVYPPPSFQDFALDYINEYGEGYKPETRRALRDIVRNGKAPTSQGMDAAKSLYGSGGKPASPAPGDGIPTKAGPAGSPMRSEAGSGSGTVSPAQEAALLADEKRVQNLLDAMEKKYGIGIQK